MTLGFQQISTNIWRLEIKYKVLGLLSLPVSTWLVRTGADWTLIDAGPPETGDQVVAAIARLTQSQGPRQILLTHAHADHSGGLSAIRAAWSTPILCHKAEAPFINGESDYRFLPSKNPLFLVTRNFMQTAWGIPIAKTLESGESAAGMAVIHLPGHSPGQLGFLHPSDQAMICGDAVMNLKNRLSPPIAAFSQDPKLASASMHRLSELDFIHLLPSHGDPILNRGREAILSFLGYPTQDKPLGSW
jgi:glyoxylase-like metal-dependent hydrolase (beta-lactamase superfamily II)